MFTIIRYTIFDITTHTTARYPSPADMYGKLECVFSLDVSPPACRSMWAASSPRRSASCTYLDCTSNQAHLFLNHTVPVQHLHPACYAFPPLPTIQEYAAPVFFLCTSPHLNLFPLLAGVHEPPRMSVLQPPSTHPPLAVRALQFHQSINPSPQSPQPLLAPTLPRSTQAELPPRRSGTFTEWRKSARSAITPTSGFRRCVG